MSGDTDVLFHVLSIVLFYVLFTVLFNVLVNVLFHVLFNQSQKVQGPHSCSRNGQRVKTKA
jgi:hypothetical protein